MLRSIQGRSTDFVVAEDGTVMHGLALIYILHDLPGISSFKIIQESRRHIRVQIVPVHACASTPDAQIRDGFRARLGSSVDVSIEQVDNILPDRSGKFRYAVSHALGPVAETTVGEVLQRQELPSP